MNKKLTFVALAAISAQLALPMSALAYEYYDPAVKNIGGFSADQYVSGDFKFNVTVGRDWPIGSVMIQPASSARNNDLFNLACSDAGANIASGETKTISCSLDTTKSFTEAYQSKNFVNGQQYYIVANVRPQWNIGFKSFLVDNEKPAINLVNDNMHITIERFTGSYVEESGSVSDRFSGVSEEDLKISGAVDNTKVGDYHIGYTVKDNAGNQTSMERIVSVVDTTAPQALVNVLATAGNNSVMLNWVNPSDPDFAGVNIYRSEIAGDKGISLKSTPYVGTNFIDTGLKSGVQYFYTVEPVDDQGLIGQSTVVSVRTNIPAVVSTEATATGIPVATVAAMVGSDISATPTQGVLGAQTRGTEANNVVADSSAVKGSNTRTAAADKINPLFWLWLILGALVVSAITYFTLKNRKK